VPPLTFFAEMGAAIAERRPHTDVLELFRPGHDLDEEKRRKTRAGLGWAPSSDDLYADAVPALTALSAAGYSVAVFANQPLAAETLMAALPVDRFAASARWGVAKPDPAFFARVATELDVDPPAVAYVGDRVDNDVLPAKAVGMRAVHLARGPWGSIQSRWPEARDADATITGLGDLVPALAALSR
jgi:HAD superfamily hydrolase (TIGR01509 family)